MTKESRQIGRKRAEVTLRRHIRRILTKAGFEPPLPQLRLVEDEVLELFQDYGNAPQAARDNIYARGKKRIIKTLRP